MASAEREPITKVWSVAPVGIGSRDPGAEEESGGEAPEAECFFCFCVSKASCKFPPLLIFAKVSRP